MKRSFFITLFLYLALFGAFFYLNPLFSSPPKPQPISLTSIQLIAPTPKKRCVKTSSSLVSPPLKPVSLKSSKFLQKPPIQKSPKPPSKPKSSSAKKILKKAPKKRKVKRLKKVKKLKIAKKKKLVKKRLTKKKLYKRVKKKIKKRLQPKKKIVKKQRKRIQPKPSYPKISKNNKHFQTYPSSISKVFNPSSFKTSTISPKTPTTYSPIPHSKRELKRVKPSPPKTSYQQRYLSNFANAIRKAILANRYYPRIAKRTRKEGVVEVRFTLLPTGRVENIQVVRSSGYKVLDKGAIKTIQRASYYFPKPSQPVTLKVPIQYRLR